MPLFITALKDGAKHRNKCCNVFRLFSKRTVQNIKLNAATHSFPKESNTNYKLLLISSLQSNNPIIQQSILVFYKYKKY